MVLTHLMVSQCTGDIYVFDSNLVTTQGYNSGTSAGRCVVLEDDTIDDNWFCMIVLEFPEGDVVFTGLFSDLAAVAGTDCFEGITGSVTTGGNPDSDAFTYQVNEETSPPNNCDASLFDGTWLEEGGYLLVDWDNNGPSSGDSYVWNDREIMTDNGEQGFSEGECLVLEDTDPDKAFCTITFRFGDNILKAMGEYDNMVIIGGLGCFYGISGSISGNVGNPTNEFVLSLNNSIPTCPSPEIFDSTWLEVPGEIEVDYGLSSPGSFAGNYYAFTDKTMSAGPTDNAEGGIAASNTGRCVFLQDTSVTFCSMIITLDFGSIALQGFYEKMTVVGGS